jgi:hypothetical protein
MKVSARDVSCESVVWVCSADCEEDLPVSMKAGKQLLVGPTKRKCFQKRLYITHAIFKRNQPLLRHSENPRICSIPGERIDDKFCNSATLFQQVSVVNTDSDTHQNAEHLGESNGKENSICLKSCPYERAIISGQPMVDCFVCSKRFHEKCVNFNCQDMPSNAIWLCCEQCEADLPVSVKSANLILIGVVQDSTSMISSSQKKIHRAKVHINSECESVQVPKQLNDVKLSKLESKAAKGHSTLNTEILIIANKSLAKFLHVPLGTSLTRMRVNAVVLEYLQAHQLFDQADANFIVPDERLKSLFALKGRCKLKKLAKAVHALAIQEPKATTPSLKRTQPDTSDMDPLDSGPPVAQNSKTQKQRLFHQSLESALLNTAAEEDEDDLPLFSTPVVLFPTCNQVLDRKADTVDGATRLREHSTVLSSASDDPYLAAVTEHDTSCSDEGSRDIEQTASLVLALDQTKAAVGESEASMPESQHASRELLVPDQKPSELLAPLHSRDLRTEIPSPPSLASKQFAADKPCISQRIERCGLAGMLTGPNTASLQSDIAGPIILTVQTEPADPHPAAAPVGCSGSDEDDVDGALLDFLESMTEPPPAVEPVPTQCRHRVDRVADGPDTGMGPGQEPADEISLEELELLEAAA